MMKNSAIFFGNVRHTFQTWVCRKMLSIPINVFPRGFLVDSTSLVVDPPHSFITTIIIFVMLSPSSLIDYLVSVNSFLGLRQGGGKGKDHHVHWQHPPHRSHHHHHLHHHHLHHYNHGSPVDPEQRLEHQCGSDSVWSGPTSPQETLSRGRDGAGEGRAWFEDLPDYHRLSTSSWGIIAIIRRAGLDLSNA